MIGLVTNVHEFTVLYVHVLYVPVDERIERNYFRHLVRRPRPAAARHVRRGRCAGADARARCQSRRVSWWVPRAAARRPARPLRFAARTRGAMQSRRVSCMVGPAPGPPRSGGVGASGRHALRGGGKGPGRCGVALCGATPCTRTAWGRVVERGAIVHNFPAARCRCCDGALLRVCAPTPRSALPG